MVKLNPDENLEAFLSANAWGGSILEPLTGDASVRKYSRLKKNGSSAILMDASRVPESVHPFIQIDEHLRRLGFSAPAMLARNEDRGLLLLEDFGDATFAGLLTDGNDATTLYTLAVDVLIALHRDPQAIPSGLRPYDPEKMLSDIELHLELHSIPESGQLEFKEAWREVLPSAHEVPSSLLLRDYHVANLMRLPERDGIRQAGLLDFQDAYQGPVTYDLVSLLEDARRDIAEDLKSRMLRRYLDHFPTLDRDRFKTSWAILASLRHTRVLAIFERLSRLEGKHEYKRLHSPRVEMQLHTALKHPRMARVKKWIERYAR